MHHLRSLAAFAGVLSLAGCSSLLGLDDFEAGEATSTTTSTSTGDPTTSTGATTTTTTSGPGQGGGGVGGQGQGGDGHGGEGQGGNGQGGAGHGGAGQGGSGGGQVLSCTANAPFDVFSVDELDGEELDDERIFAIPKPGDNRVHVVSRTQGSQIVLRTVQGGAVPDLSQVIVYPSTPDGIDRRFGGGYLTADNELHLWGVENHISGEFVFASNSQVQGPGEFVPFPKPAACQDERATAAFLASDGTQHFAATCSGPNGVLLYGGPTVGANAFVIGPVGGPGSEPPPEYQLREFAFIGGKYFLLLGQDNFAANATLGVRTGADQSALETFHPLTLPPDTGFFMIMGPATETGLFAGAIHADPDLLQGGSVDGGLASAVLGPDDLLNLADDPLGVLDQGFAFTSLEDVAAPNSFARAGANFVAGAVSNFSISAPTTARFYQWDEVGAPTVVGFPVFEGDAETTLLTGAAAPGGFGTSLVVWNELNSAGYETHASVVQCAAP